MTHLVSIAISLALLWLLLSGHYTPLLLSLGFVSVVLVTALIRRMELVDHETHPVNLDVRRVVAYWAWLMREIVVANWQVARIVLSPRLPIAARVMHVPASQRTDFGRVIYANSITLTPGTVTIDVDRDGLEVHALDADFAAGLQTGEMDRRVSAVEAQ